VERVIGSAECGEVILAPDYSIHANWCDGGLKFKDTTELEFFCRSMNAILESSKSSRIFLEWQGKSLLLDDSELLLRLRLLESCIEDLKWWTGALALHSRIPADAPDRNPKS